MITFTQLGKAGRAGNQIFQAMAVIALAAKNDDDFILPYCDLTYDFSIPLEKFSRKISPTCTYKEPYFHYSPIPIQDTKNITLNLSGHFQSYLYWQGYEDLFLKYFSPKISFGTRYDTASIHIRHGDYLTMVDCYANIEMDYYKKAMEILSADEYLIFSDDPEWCRENFVGDQFTIIEGNSPITDLALMISCEKGNIIANSSFSYFGAYLNQHQKRKVVAPNKWFGPKLSHHNTKDLIPGDWIKI